MKIFTEREIRAVVIFLPLAGLLIAAFILLQPKADPDDARRMEREMEEPDTVLLCMHRFDPNTADFRELRQLGLTKYEAISVLKYRATGRFFRIPEDMTLCYGVSDSLYAKLEPWIRIGRKYAITPYDFREGRILPDKLPPSAFRIDTVSVRYLRAIGAMSKRQAEAFIRWRDLSGIYDMEELRACYVVSDSVASALEPYIIFPVRKLTPAEDPISLNRADSSDLVRINGIGPRTARAILDYRERLGGFVKVEQLTEIPGITEHNFEKILKQIVCNPYEIQKIDINFAPPKVLGRHPYIAPQTLRRILKARALKGGWNTIEEMTDQKILTQEEAARLAPYLRFGHDNGSGNQ